MCCCRFSVLDKDNVDGENAQRYEGIYGTMQTKKMEGFESPFSGVKEPRKLVVDIKKLKIQEALGNNLMNRFLLLDLVPLDWDTGVHVLLLV